MSFAVFSEQLVRSCGCGSYGVREAPAEAPGFFRDVAKNRGLVMASVYDRLKREEATVRATVATLHEDLGMIRRQIAAAEERLRDLALTQKTLDSLPPDDAEGPGDSDTAADGPGGQEAGGEPDADPGAGAGAAQDPDSVFRAGTAASGPLDWEEGRRRMLSVLATAGRGMKAREIAAAIGEDVSTAARVETTRGRLKRLVQEGLVAEDAESLFTIASNGPAGAGEEAPRSA